MVFARRRPLLLAAPATAVVLFLEGTGRIEVLQKVLWGC